MTVGFRPADLRPCKACATISIEEPCPLMCERRFITSQWSSSFKSSHYAGMIYTDDWATVMHPQISRVLDRPDTTTIVAFDDKDRRFLYGFICGDVSQRPPIVFYVYIREPFRKWGYARGLFGELGVDPTRHFLYTAKTGMVPRLAEKIPAARYEPRVVRYPKEQRRDRHGN